MGDLMVIKQKSLETLKGLCVLLQVDSLVLAPQLRLGTSAENKVQVELIPLFW